MLYRILTAFNYTYRTRMTITAISEEVNPKRNVMAVVVHSFFFVG